MILKGKTFKSLGSLALFFAIVFVANPGHTQNTRWSIPPDPRMVIIPARSMQEIAEDLDNAMATKQLAINRNAQAVDRLNQIASAIESRKTSVDDIDRRKEDAKNNKRESEATSLQIEAKANKQAIDLLKRLRDLREAEVEAAKTDEDHADMAIRVFQMESELQNKRSEYNWQSIGGAGNLTQNTAYQVIIKLEESLLKLQQELASVTQKVASKQKDVVNQRINLHEAQLKLGM